MMMTTQETIKEIKKQFRLFMNGIVSQSMRETMSMVQKAMAMKMAA